MVRFILPVLILLFGSVGYLVYQYQQNVELRLANDFERQNQRIAEIVRGYQINSDVTFENTIMQPDVLEILHQVSRATPEEFRNLHNRLHYQLVDKYEHLKRIARVRQLHFHLPDGRSFLRMHRPEKYGDPLFDVRYSVKLANTKLVRSQGFEEGRIFNGYRFVYPIQDRNKHLGSVEISLSMKAITQSLSDIYGGTHCFMLDTNTIGEKVFADEKQNYKVSPFGTRFAMDKKVDNELCSIDNPLVNELTSNEKLKANLDKLRHYSDTIGNRLHFDGYVAQFIPVKNIEDEKIAYIFSIHLNQEISSLYDRFIYNIILTLFVFGLIVGVIFVLNKRKEALENHTITLKKTVTSLTHKYDGVLQEQQYIKGLLETIFNVIDHLNRLGKIEKLLYESCENLMHNDHYRFTHIYSFHGEITVPVSETALKEGLSHKDLIDFYSNLRLENALQTMLKHGETVAINGLLEKEYAAPIKEFLIAQKIDHGTLVPIRSNDNITYGFLMLLTTHEQTAEERILLKKLGVTISQSIITLNRRDKYELALQEKAKHYKYILFEIVDLLEKRYVFTAGRSYRVSQYAKKIGMAMKLDNKSLNTLIDAAMLRDIGYIKLPDNIFLKTGKITPQERSIIESHVACGAHLLDRLQEFKEVRETILFHHEKYDGSGYPHGLKEDKIPLLSRILAVADAFEAMTSYWIYKPPKTTEQAIAELEKCKGSQFDPQVVHFASFVLKDLAPEKPKPDLPHTGLEFVRLQHLLQDPETGIFDVRYLDMLVSNQLNGLSIQGIQVISVAHLESQTSDQHKATLFTLGLVCKRFYPNDLTFFIQPNLLVIIHLENFDENLQSGLLERVGSDKHIEFKVESFNFEENQSYMELLRKLLMTAANH